MDIIFVILLIFIFAFFYYYDPNSNTNTLNIVGSCANKEKFETECRAFGDNYNSCYANSNCTIGFLPDGSTQCMKKFLQEDI